MMRASSFTIYFSRTWGVSSVHICSHCRSLRNVRKCLWKILPDPFKISFFIYGIFGILILSELYLAFTLSSGPKKIGYIVEVVEFICPRGRYKSQLVPIVGILYVI